MADFQIGSGGKGGDRYKVGWNESKSNLYKVANSKESLGMPKKALPDDQASPAGLHSAFSHDAVDTKDDGSMSPNMGFGGEVSSGPSSDPTGDGGALKLEMTQKGDSWTDQKNAMAKRKAQMESYRQVMGEGQFETPTVDLVQIKK